jgi:hypothetical protein
MSSKTVLTARWTENQESPFDPPTTLKWNDGSVGTFDEFMTHLGDTSTLEYRNGGMEMTMFVDVCADVRYDMAAKSWVVDGPLTGPMSLDLSDPLAASDQIESRLSILSVYYRARVHRDSVPAVPLHKRL